MVFRSVGLLAAFLCGAAAPSAIVVNPVAAPVAPGITIGIERFAKAPAIAPTWNSQARIQQMKPLGDGSGRHFLNDTAGLIEVVGAAGGTPTVWFDVKAAVAGFSNANASQMGLMSFAFHPNFNRDPSKPGYATFYVFDTETAASGTATLTANGPVDHHNVVREYIVEDPTAATARIASTREVLRATQPYSDHGPGMISFNTTAKLGDADYGNLYISMGDGGNWADINDNAQDLRSPAGKILRIDPADPDGTGAATYTIPTENPFRGEAGKLGEVWAYGLRNPQSFSWDEATGKMVVIDIGFSSLEEVNVGQAGGNYGWPIREGTYARADRWGESVYDAPANDGRFIDPIAQYDHEEIFRAATYGLAAISGAFVYNGSLPELQGMLVLSDLVSGRVFYSAFNDGAGSDVMSELFFLVDGVTRSFAELEQIYGRTDLRLAEMADGELAFLFKSTGDIWRITAVAEVPEPASWALMILGFGAVGASIRRRRAWVAA